MNKPPDIAKMLTELIAGMASKQTKGGAQKKDWKKPDAARLAKITDGTKDWTTADLVRFTATGNRNGRVTHTINDLLRSLGDRSRGCCIWTLAVLEGDYSMRERAGAILTTVLRKELGQDEKGRHERTGHE